MWKTVKLGDVCTFLRGLTYSKKNEVEYSKTAVLRATNIDLGTYSLKFDEIRYISDDVKINEEKYAKAGDILMCTASGSKSHLGKVALVTNDTGMAFGGFMAVLRTKGDCLSTYLYLVLTSPLFSAHLSTISEGTNINNLKFSQIDWFEFLLPPLSDQQRIAAKLDAAFAEIDKAIAAAARKRQQADKLKQSILRSELSADDASWKTVKLSDAARVIAGQSPQSVNYNKNGDGLPFYQGKKDYGERYLNPPTVWTTKVTKRAKKDDILISVRAPVGALNIATEEICIGRGLAAIRAKEVIDRDFLYFQLLSAADHIEGGAGVIFNSTNKKQLENITLFFPPLTEQRRIVAKLDAAFAETAKLTEAVSKQIANYRALKSAILARELQSEAA